MLSPEALEQYRRMSLSERLVLVLQMIRDETPHLLAGPPQVVDRRFELLRRENDLRNRAMLEGLARAKANERVDQVD
jgi:hypothetical protein